MTVMSEPGTSMVPVVGGGPARRGGAGGGAAATGGGAGSGAAVGCAGAADLEERGDVAAGARGVVCANDGDEAWEDDPDASRPPYPGAEGSALGE